MAPFQREPVIPDPFDVVPPLPRPEHHPLGRRPFGGRLGGHR